MKTFLFVLSFVSCFLPSAHGQPVIAAKRIEVGLDNQLIVGASFDENANRFFVQQEISSDVDHVLRTHRRIYSWSLDHNVKLAERDLDLDPPMSHLHRLAPCGSIGVATKSNRILVCGLRTIEVLDATSLKTLGTIVSGIDETTYEIAVDEARNRVLLLSGRSGSLYPLSYSGSLWLTSYSLSDGTQQQSVQLGSLGLVDHAELGFDPERGRVAVSITHRGLNPPKSDLYVCDDVHLTGCAFAGEVDAVSQMSFMDNELLFVSNRNDRKSDCVMGLDLKTNIVTREYCATTTGVRFALGVPQETYVVAFTGTRRHEHFMSEGYVDVQNTFSLWCSGEHQVGGSAQYLPAPGVDQSSVRIVASRTRPLFLAYSDMDNPHQRKLELYSLSGCK